MWTLYDYERANVEYACAFSNHSIDEKLYRTHRIRTVSRSCEYACGFSNDQIDENSSRKHHTHTASRSCEYTCGFSNH